MFGTLGGPELFLIFVVALIVFGPRKLPDIGKSLGRMMSEFRRASNEFRSTIESEVESEKIRESMRIEEPKVQPVKAGPPAATSTGPDGDANGPEASSGSGDHSGPDSREEAGLADGTASGEGEELPSTESRQPPPPAPDTK